MLNRAAAEIASGQIVNLGIGLPTQLINYLPESVDVLIQSENGVLGAWKQASKETADAALIDAGGVYTTTREGSCFFDSAVSFAMIRRGKVDMSVMGAFEVDELGNLANWKIPGRFSPGIGGAMELAQKTPRIVILCSHNDKRGNPKILKRCTLPLTAKRCVSRIITDKAVMDVTKEGLLLREIAENIQLDDLLAQTGAELKVSDQLERF
ncbi:3-oxoacid CoA-transferase subunit B [Pseudomaricurvus alkylphenolicus]|nr:3-oxoacid CoA-transferase subunit B [Pseudomaricurvus alkylphenolicus]NIB38572.1 3-oxoacid CoA-transferase subunit B [Pseudomaricurvus alkylphenolicus]